MTIKDNLMDMDLQFFAEPTEPTEPTKPGTGTEPNPVDNGGTPTEPKEPVDPQGKTFTREDLAKMIAAEKSKIQEEANKQIEAARSEGKTEGEKLAKLTAEQRAKLAEDQRAKELEDRENALNKRELEVATKTELSKSGLPETFLDLVLAKDAESTNQRIETVKKSFNDAVNAEVVERMKGTTPKTGGAASGDSMTDRIQQRLSKAKG